MWSHIAPRLRRCSARLRVKEDAQRRDSDQHAEQDRRDEREFEHADTTAVQRELAEEAQEPHCILSTPVTEMGTTPLELPSARVRGLSAKDGVKVVEI
jgi:hypothetical protein